MRKVLRLLLLLVPFFCSAQQNLQKIRTSSWQTHAYKVSAADAEDFMQWDSIPVIRFQDITPTMIFPADSVDETKLGIGNFILLSVVDNKVKAVLVNNSNLIMLTINNKDRLQIDVRNRAGLFIEKATVFVNGKEAIFNKESNTFWVKERKLDKAKVKIYAPSDTLYKLLSLSDRYTPDISNQKKQNFKLTKIYKIVNWIPFNIKKLFAKKKASNNIHAGGYIIFNQPKYKPLDTLKFKAYVIDKKWKQYNKKVDVFISYYDKGKSILQFIKTLRPISSGAFVDEIALSDTLPLDTRYTLLLKTKSDKQIISNTFKIEEYVLDEIGFYSFKADKEMYYRNDSIRFFANAKDANGLNLLDGKAALLLTTNSIKSFYRDTVFVIDTLYYKELKLNTTEDTKFVIPADMLPNAFLEINATLSFTNANNELHVESTQIAYKYFSKEILVSQELDSIKAVFIENGMEKNATGQLEIGDEKAINIGFPFIAKIDPTIEAYSFLMNDDDVEDNDFYIKDSYQIQLSGINNGDTLGFILNNPYKIPVYYSIFSGTNIIASAKSNLTEIKWQKLLNDNSQLYKVRWQYYWAGKEIIDEENIGLYFKNLNIQVTAKDIVFPGQKDSLKINITDYKGKPANNVNLTAVSYNNQFKKDIKVSNPPLLIKYKSKGFLENKSFSETKMPVISKTYLLGKNIHLLSKFSLDTMTYYKLLFPIKGIYDAPTRISSFVPQVSINLVEKGVPQEIYLLYLNRNLVYYNGVTDKMKYAFDVFPGIVQIGIRTKDKYIEIDSFYIQPNYKHDISFDIDNLPPHSTITPTKKYWTLNEMDLLESSMWQMQNNYNNNNAYLWQGSRLVHLSGNREHIAGPFVKDGISFFSLGYFDINFTFEPGYQYNLSPKILRLEKKPLFVKKDTSNLLLNFPFTALTLGDTIVEPPTISYPLPEKRKFILYNTNYTHYAYAGNQRGVGRIQYSYSKDSIINYIILFNNDSNKIALVTNNQYGKINNLLPGNYTLLLVTNNFNTATFDNIIVKPDGTSCVKTDTLKFVAGNEMVSILLAQAEESLKPKETKNPDEIIKSFEIKKELKFVENGTGRVTGVILDSKSINPIPYCSIKLNGYDYGVSSDGNGYFILQGLKSQEYILEFASVGYQTKLVKVNLTNNQNYRLEVKLDLSVSYLNEIVVSTALGKVRSKSSLGSATVTISSKDLRSVNIVQGLQGRAAGVLVQSTNDGVPGGSDRITLRGIRSLTGNNQPLLVVDGIISRLGKFSDINPNDIADVTILSSSAATAIYGPDGVNGAIVVTTKNKTERKEFRDYAIWQPNFFTDKKGNAAFVVTYPDNVTGWKTFVIAMDKKRRIGKTSFITQAYKPIVAQLNLPTFLVEGDSSYFIGKSLNYTADKYNVKTEFSLNGIISSSVQKDLMGNDANIEKLLVTTNTTDSLKAKFALQTTTGFKDGEDRIIPVFKKGTEEAVGNFWVLQNDTTVSFSAINGKAEINIYAQNNTLDLLLDEIKHLKTYPYVCMEQTTSKLTGLAMEKKIMEHLKSPFEDQKVFDMLLQKVQKAQLFDGGWPWWEGGKANFYITNYILNALLLYRENPLVESNIRNGFLYLQNQLPLLNKSQLLVSLVTLSEGNHQMDYTKWINKIEFDSITQHEQWQWVKIKQQQKMEYKAELKKLIDKKTNTMLGGLHWGTENYRWYGNDIATTIIAFNVLKNETEYKNLLPNIIQYFLEKRRGGYWVNTVESATILNTILPEILQTQKEFNKPAMINITGDSTFIISTFPFKYTTKNTTINKLNITKSGGGLVYFTAYQKVFNTTPEPVVTNFIASTSFQKNGQTMASIKAGERMKMIVTIEVLKDAEFVMLQVPIPAGCLFVNKSNYAGGVYREFFKDKVAMFAETLPKGKHVFEIELEPRYNGTYNLNPTKVELMYYPTFFGRNEMKKIAIVEN